MTHSITITVSKKVFGTGCHNHVCTIELASGDNKTWKENTHKRMGNWATAFKTGVFETLEKGLSVQEFVDNASFCKQKNHYRFNIVANQ